MHIGSQRADTMIPFKMWYRNWLPQKMITNHVTLYFVMRCISKNLVARKSDGTVVAYNVLDDVKLAYGTYGLLASFWCW